jgi:hypothetical protein
VEEGTTQGIVKKKKIDSEAIFLQAIEFHIAFRALQEWKPGHPKPRYPSREGAMDKPAAVINAFSSELLLKTLISIETGPHPERASSAKSVQYRPVAKSCLCVADT